MSINKSLILIICILGTLTRTLELDAQTNVGKMLTDLNEVHDDSVKVGLYYKISHYYQYSHPDSAVYYLQQGLAYFTNSNYKRGEASLLSMLGSQEANHGNLDIATKRQRQSLAIFEEVKYKRGIGVAQNALGVIEGRRGNFDSATVHFLIALKVYEEIGYKTGIVDAYLNLGHINDDFNNYDKALDYYQKALSIQDEAESIRNVCTIYNNIAIVYGKKGELEKSLSFLEKALSKSNKDDYIDVYLYSMLNMGIIYSKYGDKAKALTCLNDALEIAKNKELPIEYANILVNIANITGETDAPKAINQLQEALKIAKSVGDKPMIEEVYFGLAELNKKTGNFKYVVSVLEELKKYQDSTSSLDKAKEVANLQAVRELEQSNNKIEQLKLTEQRDRLKKNILYTIVAGLAIFIIFILVYLTKTRQLNSRLTKQEEDLKAANAIKDRLFSIIGHDLRSPIGSMTLVLDLLEGKTTNKEDEYLLHSLQDQATATLDTLDKLLFWGKAQIAGNKIEKNQLATKPLIDKKIALLRPIADQKHITLTNNIAETVTVFADQSHFDFVVRNLLSNAIKFTPEGGSVEISADEQMMPDSIVFAVKDTGVGISKEKMVHIFEPFVNVSVGTAQEKGTGIGLMLCKEFVSENDGKIWAESVEGRGTTFYFSLKKF